MFLNKKSTNLITTFSDADWGGNIDDRTSTTGYIIYLDTNPISWKSTKKRTVSRSFTKVEYRALANMAFEIVWFTNRLHKLKVPLQQKPKLFCDNVGATYLSLNPVFHSRVKHIALDYRFVRQRIQSGSARFTLYKHQRSISRRVH